MGRLQGKIAVVTGGNSGIGLAAAKRFAAEGARVFITGRRQAELDQAVAAIGHGVTGVQGDVAKLADIDRLFATVRASAGRVDVLMANAGLGEIAPLPAVTEAHFDLAFDVNVKGTLFTVQKALPLMGAGGSIILLGSMVDQTGGAGLSVYSATKAAIRNFARSWAQEFKDNGVRVNVLSPGPFPTPGMRGLAKTPEEERAFEAAMTAAVPMARLGTMEEIAAAALFLASEDSTYMTGAELAVDGGGAQV